MNSRRSGLTLGLFILAAGLPVGAAAPAEKAGSEGAGNGAAAKLDYVLQPQDLLRVQVYPEEDLKLEVRVTQELTIKLPLIGTVELKGKSVRQAEELIRQLYEKDYLVNPQVSVTVLEYLKRYVKVLGSVNAPGVVVFPPEEGLTLLGAIARAGGIARLGDPKKVKLTRVGPDGIANTSEHNADDLQKRGSGEDVPLQPEDLIYIAERIL